MSEPGSASAGTRRGRGAALWVVAVLPALGATGVLILTDDSRLLRLGLVAALWAALIGGFVVARLRHQTALQQEREADLKRIYELELEREVAARREFELEEENEARRRVADESGQEINTLRMELRTLRDSLENVLGGDVLFERVALQAESTRLRALAENGAPDNRIPQVPPNRGRELVAGVGNGPDFPVPNGHAQPNGHTPNGELVGRQPTPVQDQRQPAPPRPQPQVPVSAPPHEGAWGQREEGELADAPQQDAAEHSSTGGWTSPVHPGAHTAGTSVTELLATYGNSPEPRRRRRKA